MQKQLIKQSEYIYRQRPGVIAREIVDEFILVPVSSDLAGLALQPQMKDRESRALLPTSNNREWLSQYIPNSSKTDGIHYRWALFFSSSFLTLTLRRTKRKSLLHDRSLTEAQLLLCVVHQVLLYIFLQKLIVKFFSAMKAI